MGMRKTIQFEDDENGIDFVVVQKYIHLFKTN